MPKSAARRVSALAARLDRLQPGDAQQDTLRERFRAELKERVERLRRFYDSEGPAPDTRIVSDGP